MDMLASACDITKASFYHRYPNKIELTKDVLSWTHEKIAKSLFSIADDSLLDPESKLALMGEKASRLFQDGAIGCLMAVVAIDASYTNSELMEPIRAFLNEWAQAFSKVFSQQYGTTSELPLARQLVAEYEGAILMARIYDDSRIIDSVTERALQRLKAETA